MPLVVSLAARARLAKWGLKQAGSRGAEHPPGGPVALAAFLTQHDSLPEQPSALRESESQPSRLQNWVAVSASTLRRLGAYDGSLLEAGTYAAAAQDLTASR